MSEFGEVWALHTKQELRGEERRKQELPPNGDDDAYALKITDEELAREFFSGGINEIKNLCKNWTPSVGGNEVAYFLKMLQGTGLSYFRKEGSIWNALKVTEFKLPNVPNKTFYNTEKIDCNKK